MNGLLPIFMKALICILSACLSCSAAFAGPEQIIKQRAKDIRDQSNARQGVPPSSAPAPAQPQTPAAAQPQAPSAAQQSLMRFNSELGAIKAGSVLEDAQKQKLARELSGAAQFKKPSPAAVDRVVTALAKAFAAKPLPAMARTRLVQDLDAILNPAKYPQAKMPAIYTDLHSILVSNRVPIALAAEADAAVRALGAEVQK